MKVLVFDTETTGLPKYRNASVLRTQDWPYVVQLSFLLYDAGQNRILDQGDYIIRLPVGIEIEPGAQAVHGISLAHCQSRGIPMFDALRHFNEAVAKCDLLLAHNIKFDKKLMMVEARRFGFEHPFKKPNGEWIPEYCTMTEGTNLCKIERKSDRTGEIYYKYPKLSELHKHLFEYEPKGMHDSMADILCCLRCYFKMNFGRDILFDNRQIASLWREKCICDDVIIFA
jgi:DNA polymerase III epsilon subunit-like protein